MVNHSTHSLPVVFPPGRHSERAAGGDEGPTCGGAGAEPAHRAPGETVGTHRGRRRMKLHPPPPTSTPPLPSLPPPSHPSPERPPPLDASADAISTGVLSKQNEQKGNKNKAYIDHSLTRIINNFLGGVRVVWKWTSGHNIVVF